jgi:hypothetical protein
MMTLDRMRETGQFKIDPNRTLSLLIKLVTFIGIVWVCFTNVSAAQKSLEGKAEKTIVDSLGRRVSDDWFRLHQLDGVPEQLRTLAENLRDLTGIICRQPANAGDTMCHR